MFGFDALGISAGEYSCGTRGSPTFSALQNRADGLTPMIFATMRGNVGIVQKMIHSAGGDVKVATPQGGTPLVLACEYGHTELVELLIAQVKPSPSGPSSQSAWARFALWPTPPPPVFVRWGAYPLAATLPALPHATSCSIRRCVSFQRFRRVQCVCTLKRIAFTPRRARDAQ